MMRPAFAILADGRFPAGGHVHSAGVEAAVFDGRIRDLAGLEAYVRGRLWSLGRTEAALAAATAVRMPSVELLPELDAEAEARITVPSLRTASRRQGRQLARAAAACWPSPSFAALDDMHVSVVWGVVGAAAGLDSIDVARLVVHHTVATPLQAAVRLLGLDPFAVAGLAASLADEGHDIALQAAASALGPLRDLPAASGPMLDIAACEHAQRDTALFAT